MNQIRMVKDDVGNIYLSQEDLLGIFSTRLERFPDEIEKLKHPQQSSIIGLDGQPKIIPSNPIDVAHHQGKQEMLEGIINMINITNEEEDEK